ncbi:hypothetical protein CAXC1_80013 [Candidatus Xenohaliotis californiensis]|uniref:Uncharacterized protein n=1 Tax=Candidatus Xenohaliotis californiensis TaxID=84677 RepID=A0ABP0EXW2_9RICK|nr:hypothetical protein CAXC1_80013 [Candidatus Xenohaliotis californiensis]
MLYRMCLMLFLMMPISIFANNELYINGKWYIIGLPKRQETIIANHNKEICIQASTCESYVYYLELMNRLNDNKQS